MPTVDLATFNRTVTDFARRIPVDMLVPFQKKIVLTVFRNIVFRTPVDTGRARGNWQVTISQPAETVVDGKDKSGAIVNRNAAADLQALLPFQTAWITNNLPYIQRLEDGYSTQAPGGMVQVALAEALLMFGSENIRG